MALTGLPHRVVKSFRDATQNWEWLRNYQLEGSDLASGSVTTDEILDGTIAVADLSAAALGAPQCPATIATADTYTVRTGKQVLWQENITVDGTGALVVDGDLLDTNPPAPSVPLTIEDGTSYVIENGFQELWLAPLTVDGTGSLVVDGNFLDANDAAPAYSTQFSTITHAAASAATGFANTMYYAPVLVLNDCTLTGLTYFVGGVQSGNVRAALYDTNGNRVADYTSTTAQAAINTAQSLAFDSTYFARAGRYFAGIQFTSATATALIGRGAGTLVVGTGPATPSTVTTTAVNSTLALAIVTY